MQRKGRDLQRTLKLKARSSCWGLTEDDRWLSQRRGAWGSLNSQCSFLFYLHGNRNKIMHKDPLLNKGTGQLDKWFLVFLTWLKVLQSQKPNPNNGAGFCTPNSAGLSGCTLIQVYKTFLKLKACSSNRESEAGREWISQAVPFHLKS